MISQKGWKLVFGASGRVGVYAGHALVSAHGDAPSFQHQFAPTIQRIGRYAIVPGNSGNTIMTQQSLLDNPKLLRRRPAAAAAAIGDDLNLRHKHMLRDILMPPELNPGVRSK